MYRKKIVSFIIFAMLSTLAGCGPKPREELGGIGIFGKHKLLRVESFGAVTGSVGGSFFLGIGSVSGSIGSEFKLQFYWEPRSEEIVVSSLPYSKFRFIVDESARVPSVEFVFNNRWLDSPNMNDTGLGSFLLNPNNFIESENLILAIIRISKETMEKEIYLPRVH